MLGVRRAEGMPRRGMRIFVPCSVCVARRECLGGGICGVVPCASLWREYVWDEEGNEDSCTNVDRKIRRNHSAEMKIGLL